MVNNDSRGIPLIHANAAAKRLVSAMTPFCEKIEIAGSIRRRKSEVKDIEIVCIPKWAEEGEPSDLFGEGRFRVNTLYRWAGQQQILKWIKPGVTGIEPWHVKEDGKYWRGYLASLQDTFCVYCPDVPCKVDIFLATPENFGLQYLIRTGNADFSKEVVTHALRVKFKVEGGKLWDCRRMQRFVGDTSALSFTDLAEVKTPDEAHVFAALNLAWVEPCDRTGAGAVQAGWKGEPA